MQHPLYCKSGTCDVTPDGASTNAVPQRFSRKTHYLSVVQAARVSMLKAVMMNQLAARTGHSDPRTNAKPPRILRKWPQDCVCECEKELLALVQTSSHTTCCNRRAKCDALTCTTSTHLPKNNNHLIYCAGTACSVQTDEATTDRCSCPSDSFAKVHDVC